MITSLLLRIAAVILAVVAVVTTYRAVRFLSDHPCVKYGPEYEYTWYLKSGDIMLPMTDKGSDCLERK